jgi:hypothetical protein
MNRIERIQMILESLEEIGSSGDQNTQTLESYINLTICLIGEAKGLVKETSEEKAA